MKLKRATKSFKSLRTKEINNEKTQNDLIKDSISKILINRKLERCQYFNIKKSKSLRKFLRKKHANHLIEEDEDIKKESKNKDKENNIDSTDLTPLSGRIRHAYTKTPYIEDGRYSYHCPNSKSSFKESFVDERAKYLMERRIKTEMREIIAEQVGELKKEITDVYSEAILALKSNLHACHDRCSDLEDALEEVGTSNYQLHQNQISINEKIENLNIEIQKNPKEPSYNKNHFENLLTDSNQAYIKEIEGLSKIAKTNSLKILKANQDLKKIEERSRTNQNRVEGVVLKLKNKLEEHLYDYKNKNTLMGDEYFGKMKNIVSENFLNISQEIKGIIQQISKKVVMMDNKLKIFRIVSHYKKKNVKEAEIDRKRCHTTNAEYEGGIFSPFKCNFEFCEEIDPDNKNFKKDSETKIIDSKKKKRNSKIDSPSDGIKKDFERLVKTVQARRETIPELNSLHKDTLNIKDIGSFVSMKGNSLTDSHSSHCEDLEEILAQINLKKEKNTIKKFEPSQADTSTDNKLSLVVNENGYLVYKNGEYVKDEKGNLVLLSEGQLEYLQMNGELINEIIN